MKCAQQADPQRQKVDQWLTGAGRRERITANGYGVSFWGDENILKLDTSDG